MLHDKWVLAVAGTHGKTSTSAMLAWILEHAGLEPGFLIGGVPVDFAVSARLTDSAFFVIEADEYDTAFFDKRSKFVHYRPRTAILNNLEFDHADIFPDLAAIETQFHHLVRTIPGNGRVIVNGGEASLARVLARGCWSEVERFGLAEVAGTGPDWTIAVDGSILLGGAPQGTLAFGQLGRHNQLNALAALAAARHVGVPVAHGLAALADVPRREAAAGIARHRARHHASTTTSPTIRPPSRRRSTDLRRSVGRRANSCGSRAALEHDENGRGQGRAAGQPRRGRSRVLLCGQPRLGCRRNAGAARQQGHRAATNCRSWCRRSSPRRGRAITSSS